jgi:hypothetical protein
LPSSSSTRRRKTCRISAATGVKPRAISSATRSRSATSTAYHDDLAIRAPGDACFDLTCDGDIGSVTLVHGGTLGLTPIEAPDRVISQLDAAIPDSGDIGDKFGLASVLYAIGMFFAGIASTFRSRARWVPLFLGTLIILGATAYGLTLPRA